MTNWNDIVNNVDALLEKFVGGEIFFDKLDESVRADDVTLFAIYMLAMGDHDDDGCKFIVSGKTGERFVSLGKCVNTVGIRHDEIYYVPGGLRKAGVTLDLHDIVKPGDKFVFMDDSYFMGRTEAVIRNAIEACGGELVDTYVFYDGCHEKHSNVHSMYRYYDHHDILGNKLD